METNSVRQLGKLLLDNRELYLTSPYTILGRTSEIHSSKELQGNLHIHIVNFFSEVLAKINIPEDGISKIKISENPKISKNSILLKFNEDTRYIIG